MKPMEEEAASGLAARIIAKINELIEWVTNERKADTAWKTEAEVRFSQLEREVREIKAENKGLKISKGKVAAAKRRAEIELEEARRLLH
jgi:hypothetical protein